MLTDFRPILKIPKRYPLGEKPHPSSFRKRGGENKVLVREVQDLPPAAVRAHRDLDPEHAEQPLRPGQRRLRRSSEFSLLIVVCHRTAVVVAVGYSAL